MFRRRKSAAARKAPRRVHYHILRSARPSEKAPLLLTITFRKGHSVRRRVPRERAAKRVSLYQIPAPPSAAPKPVRLRRRTPAPTSNWKLRTENNKQVAWLKEETRTILSIDVNIIITNYRIFLIPDEDRRKWALHIKDVRESDRVSVGARGAASREIILMRLLVARKRGRRREKPSGCAASWLSRRRLCLAPRELIKTRRRRRRLAPPSRQHYCPPLRRRCPCKVACRAKCTRHQFNSEQRHSNRLPAPKCAPATKRETLKSPLATCRTETKWPIKHCPRQV